MEIEESIKFWMYLLWLPWKIRQEKSSFIPIREKPVLDVLLCSELAIHGVQFALTHVVRVRYRGRRDELLFFYGLVGLTERKKADQAWGEPLQVKHAK